MIEKLIIRNFQCHKRLKIEFDPLVTTIVGPSDVGKSAVLRALGWVTTNHPRGEAFIRDGADKATAILSVDGHKIKRSRGSKNTYELDGSKFTAFGNATPDEIAAVLNLSELNFQGQHDAAFWFSESAGEVSRQLNSIVDLSVIDSTLSNLSSALRKANAEERVTQARLDSAREDRKSLRSVKQADKALKKVEALGEKARDAAFQRALLAALLKKAAGHQAKAKRLPKGLKTSLRRLQKKAEALVETTYPQCQASHKFH
jgi:exonuclease SbcC